jgi:hypothetical protein
MHHPSPSNSNPCARWPIRYSWREELEKFRASRRPLGGVSSLIDAFSSGAALTLPASRKASTDSAFLDLEGVKARRRGSLQIQLEGAALQQIQVAAEQGETRTAAKLQVNSGQPALVENGIGPVAALDRLGPAGG